MQLVSLSERILLIISVAVLYAIFIFIITEVALIISEIGYRNKKVPPDDAGGEPHDEGA